MLQWVKTPYLRMNWTFSVIWYVLHCKVEVHACTPIHMYTHTPSMPTHTIRTWKQLTMTELLLFTCSFHCLTALWAWVRPSVLPSSSYLTCLACMAYKTEVMTTTWKLPRAGRPCCLVTLSALSRLFQGGAEPFLLPKNPPWDCKDGSVSFLKGSTSHAMWAMAFTRITHCVQRLSLYSATALGTGRQTLPYTQPSTRHD